MHVSREEEEEVYDFLLLLCWYHCRLEVKTMSTMMLRRNHCVSVLVEGSLKHVAVSAEPPAEG